MPRNKRSPTEPAAQAIRDEVLHSIAVNRNGRLHFPGYFTGIEWSKVGGTEVCMSVPDSAHCRDASGEVDMAVVAILADTALATTARPGIPTGARLATMRMELRFNGAPITGTISAEARLQGFNRTAVVRQSISEATLYANGVAIAYASGEFGTLNPPPGVNMVSLPWENDPPSEPDPLHERDLDAHERAILKSCDRALAQASPQASFIQHFWGGVARRTLTGASNRVAVGPHIGNRVGFVQGGVLFGIAAATARAAAPASMMMATASAWYISPGRSRELRVRSHVLHAGRTIAVVRTEIKAAGGERVLEMVTHHVARRQTEHGGA